MANKRNALGAFALLISVLLAGCSSTLNGAKEDASKDTEAVRTTAENAGAAAKNDLDKAGQNIEQAGQNAAQAAKDAATAVSLVPKITVAIHLDVILNDKRNKIKVAVQDNKVHLVGHVVNPDMKTRATQDAQKVLDDSKNQTPLSNDLTVTQQTP